MSTTPDSTGGAPIIADRLAQLERLSLGHGAHQDFERGMCAMEAA